MGNKSFYQDVCDFHARFGLPRPGVVSPRHLTAQEREFRVGFMQEELNEYIEATRHGDLVKAADALVDLTYVVLGTAAFHGIPFDKIWDVVHAANMTKIRTPSARASKRGSEFDVIKPPGWVSPERKILEILIADEQV